MRLYKISTYLTVDIKKNRRMQVQLKPFFSKKKT